MSLTAYERTHHKQSAAFEVGAVVQRCTLYIGLPEITSLSTFRHINVVKRQGGCSFTYMYLETLGIAMSNRRKAYMWAYIMVCYDVNI